MAPVKFGLFKGRSRDQPEPPSTENLLQSSCTDLVVYSPPSLPSTSKGLFEDHTHYGFHELSMLHLDSDDEDDSDILPVPRRTSVCPINDTQLNYTALSTNATSTTTLQPTELDFQEEYDFQDQLLELHKSELVTPDDATSIDASSLQFDETSIMSEDVKYCGTTKKQKKNKSKEEQKIQAHKNDVVMWQASNYEVLQHLLSRSGSHDEQIKWEVIAAERGLCNLTATCTCGDCGKSPSQQARDCDLGAIGAAPLLGALTGCELQ